MRLKFSFGLAMVALALASVSVARAQVNMIRINEVLADNVSYSNSDGSVTDLLELYNTGASDVVLTGSSLTDSNLFPRRFVFDATNGIVRIQPGEFLRIMFDSRFSNNLSVASPPFGVKVPFGIKASGGYMFFYSAVDPITPVSYVEYGLQISDHSIGHVTDGSGPWELTRPTFGAANVPVELGVRSALRINEWLVKESGNGGNDFIELFNPPTNKPVNIGGMYLSDTTVPAQGGVTKFRIADLSFIGTNFMGGFRRFTCDGNTSTPKYPADETNFGLGDGEQLVLTDTNGVLNIDFIGSIDYGANTNVNDVSRGRLPDGSANFVSFPKINDYETKSPGEPNFLIFPYTNGIIVNELLSHTDPPLEDAVEFQNRAATNINISGWWLSNSRFNRKRYQIPGAAAILPGRFRVIYEGATNGVGFGSPSAADPFTFNSAHGDNIVLSQVDASGNLTGYIVYEEFESAANGVSFGHYDTSVSDDYKFVSMSSLTFGTTDPANILEFRTGTGQTNSYPRVGPIVINEVMFAPAQTTYLGTNGTNITGENPAEEYIELRNITSEAVPLYTIEYSGAARAFITNYWKLQTAVRFDLPLTNVAPNSFCIVVGFDPATNVTALTNLRARFNISNDVPIFGPWRGQLNNGGDAIEFYRPDPVQQPPHPDAGFVPYFRVDKVNYKTAPPWPGGANGTGRSLQRKNSLLFGNDPINWATDTPNPGRASVALQDTDGDGMPDAWETANGFNPNNPSDAGLDADGDGVTNLGEYVGGTNPHDPLSFLTVSEIVAYQGTNIAVRFLAYSNATYSVQYRNSMNPGSVWQRLGDILAAPSNRVVEVPDLTAWKKADRYYRVIAPAAN